MKRIALLCALVLGGICFAQDNSDYAIVQRFQATTKQISKAIEATSSVQECASISRRIEDLGKEFQQHQELLDKALYPDSYASIINDLRAKLALRQRDLTTIEHQGGQIQELEVRIKELSAQIDALTAQNEKLMSDVQRLSQNLKKLTGDLFSSATPLDSLQQLVVKLRNGLQERDALITSLLDSLFLQYDKNIEQMKESDKKELVSKVERYGALSNVKRSLQDNITFVEITNLKGADAQEIYKQYQRLQSVWNSVGPKLTALYSTGKQQKKSDLQSVDSLFVQWNLKINSAVWRSLNTLFREKDFSVIEFNNGNEFVSNLSAFLETQIKNKADESKETRYKNFTKFNEQIWIPELQLGWFPTLLKMGEITETQKADLEEKFEKWKSSVEPASSVLPVVLIIVVAILLIVLIAWYWRQRNTPEPEES